MRLRKPIVLNSIYTIAKNNTNPISIPWSNHFIEKPYKNEYSWSSFDLNFAEFHPSSAYYIKLDTNAILAVTLK